MGPPGESLYSVVRHCTQKLRRHKESRARRKCGATRLACLRCAGTRRRSAEEAFVLLAHFAAANLDRSVILDPAADQAEAGVRRTVVHALGHPALAREGGQYAVCVAGV